MNRFRTWKRFNLMLAVLLPLCSGCTIGQDTWWYLGDRFPEQEQYRENMTEIDHPNVVQLRSEEVELTAPPRTLATRKREEIWDLGIQEAIHKALINSEVIRTSGQFLNPGNSLLTNPTNTPTIYDPAIQDSGVLFGGVGTEAALAAFDTTWATTMFWGRNESVQNSAFNGGAGGTALLQDTANFNSSLTKQFAYGAQLSLSQQINFLGSNNTATLFPSSYSGNVQAEYRHQLLSGAGPDYVRVAGPLNSNFSSISGVSNGVLIARINADISITNFEANVRNLVKDIEDTYWDLYLAYRNFDTAVTARNTALDTWRIADSKRRIGGLRGFSNSEEAQSRDRYFETRAQAENALGNLYATEQRLRNLMGLPVNDHRVIRPADAPISAKLAVDWYHSMAEALTERVELRRQKWNIKSLELQLGAAENFARPRLDFVARMRRNGFGDTLASQNDRDVLGGDRNSYFEKLAQGDETGWDLGLELTVPFGLRLAKTQVTNLELRLTKARKVLAAQELEIGHELAVAFQDIERTYATAVSNYSRRSAALERVKMIGKELEIGSGSNTLDRYLRAQESLAAAESAYHQSLVDYNKAVVNIYYRKGTLLRQDNIHLMEGRWRPEAYKQAFDRARARAHAIPAPYLETLPAPFAADGHIDPINFRAPEADGYQENLNGTYPQEVHLPLPSDEVLAPQPDDKTNAIQPNSNVPSVPAEKPNSNKKPYFEKEASGILKLPVLNELKETRAEPKSKTKISLFPIASFGNKTAQFPKQNLESRKKTSSPKPSGQVILFPVFQAEKIEFESNNNATTIPTLHLPASQLQGGWQLDEQATKTESTKTDKTDAFPILPTSHKTCFPAQEKPTASKKSRPKMNPHQIGKSIPSPR